MEIEDLLGQGAISLRVSASDRRQALSVVAEIAARQFGLKASTVLNALLRRETQGSTGVGHGVAIPHARLRGLDQMRGIFVQLEHPIDFSAVDECPVDLMFVLLTPADSSDHHLMALAKITRALRSSETRAQLRSAASPDAVRALMAKSARPTVVA